MAKNITAKTWALTTGADGRKYSETADAPLSGGSAALRWESPLRNGDTITITTDGTYNFGSKTNAKPMYYWDAGVENTLNSSPLSRRSFVVTNDSSPTLVTDVKPTNAAASLRFSYDAGTTAQGEIVAKTGGAFMTDLDSAGSHIIVMMRRRFSYSLAEGYAVFANFNHKHMRWWSQVGSNNIVMGPQVNSTGYTPEYTDSTYYFPNNTLNNPVFFEANKNNWTSELLQLSTGTVDQYDAIYRRMNNGEMVSGTFRARKTDGGYTNPYREFYFHQAQIVPNDQGWYAWVDYIYIDDTPQAVLISDAPTWDTTGTYRYEPFIPTAWTTTSITAVVRKGEFASTSGKYLYILGADGNPIRTAGLAL